MFSPITFKSQRALDAAKSINRKTGYRAGEQKRLLSDKSDKTYKLAWITRHDGAITWHDIIL